MKPFHVLLMLFIVAVWGFNFVAMRVVLEKFSPEQMALARSVLTLAILLPWWKPFERIPWQLVAAALAIGTGSFYLLYQAIRITESLTTVAVGTQLMPPISVILALVLFREQVSSRKWLGILIATAGAIYLAGATKSGLSVKALGLTVVSVLLYSFGSVMIGKFKSVSVWRMLAWISALSIPPLALLAGFSGTLYPDPKQVQIQHYLALLYAVVFSALIGQAVLFTLFRRYPVADVVPWTLLIPFFAGLSSIGVYKESIPLSLLLGGAIVLFGVWIQLSGDRDKTKKPPVI